MAIRVTDRKFSIRTFTKLLIAHEVVSYIVRMFLEFNKSDSKIVLNAIATQYIDSFMGIPHPLNYLKFTDNLFKPGMISGLNWLTKKFPVELKQNTGLEIKPYELVVYIVGKIIDDDKYHVNQRTTYIERLVNSARYKWKYLRNDLIPNSYRNGAFACTYFEYNLLRYKYFYKYYAPIVVAIYGDMYMKDPKVPAGVLVDYLAETNVYMAHFINEIAVAGGLLQEELAELFSHCTKIEKQKTKPGVIPAELREVLPYECMLQERPPYLDEARARRCPYITGPATTKMNRNIFISSYAQGLPKRNPWEVIEFLEKTKPHKFSISSLKEVYDRAWDSKD